jgi:hypothetical protein
MRYLWISIGWLVSVLMAYAAGWLRGLKSASTVALGSAHFMASAAEYFILALLAAFAVGSLYFIFVRQKFDKVPVR